MRPPDVCGQLGLALVVILASTAFEAVGLEVRIDTLVSSKIYIWGQPI